MARDLDDWFSDGSAYSVERSLKESIQSLEERLPVDGSLDGNAYREGYLPVSEGFKNAAELFRKAGAHAEDGDMDEARTAYREAYTLLEDAIHTDVEEHPFPSGLRSRLNNELERIRRMFEDLPKP